MAQRALSGFNASEHPPRDSALTHCAPIALPCPCLPVLGSVSYQLGRHLTTAHDLNKVKRRRPQYLHQWCITRGVCRSSRAHQDQTQAKRRKGTSHVDRTRISRDTSELLELE